MNDPTQKNALTWGDLSCVEIRAKVAGGVWGQASVWGWRGSLGGAERGEGGLKTDY